MVQSLYQDAIVDDLDGQYGQLIVDECHHISAVSFEQVVRECKARYVTGLSATVTRKDGHHPIIFMQCGPIPYKVDDRKQAESRAFDHRVIGRRRFREPHTLGVWVKGNSSWGKVVFEFQDAAGGVGRTHGNEWPDGRGELSNNFDGWHFIQFPIDAQSPVIYSSPGGRCQRVKGNRPSVTHPIHLTRLYVVMNRLALDPTEFLPVPPAIRISGAGRY